MGDRPQFLRLAPKVFAGDEMKDTERSVDEMIMVSELYLLVDRHDIDRAQNEWRDWPNRPEWGT